MKRWWWGALGWAALGLAGCAHAPPQAAGAGKAAHSQAWWANPATAYLVVLVALEDHSPQVPAKDLVTHSLRALQANPRLANAADTAILQSAVIDISAARPGDDDAYFTIVDRAIQALAKEQGRPDVRTLTELAVAGLADGLDAGTVFIPPCDSSDAGVRRARMGQRGVDGVSGRIVRCGDPAAGGEAAAPATQASAQLPERVFAVVVRGIIYVRLDRIGAGVDAELKTKFDQLRAGPGAAASGVILDLRESPGGLSNESASIAGLLLPEGSLIGQTIANTPADGREYSSSHGDMTGGMPLVVLVSQSTAGGAELIAGTLQEHQRARILGAKTAGYGTQVTERPILGGRLFITTGFVRLPSGRGLEGAGVQPDIEVSPDVESDGDHYIDPALRAAVVLLRRTVRV